MCDREDELFSLDHCIEWGTKYDVFSVLFALFSCLFVAAAGMLAFDYKEKQSWRMTHSVWSFVIASATCRLIDLGLLLGKASPKAHLIFNILALCFLISATTSLVYIWFFIVMNLRTIKGTSGIWKKYRFYVAVYNSTFSVGMFALWYLPVFLPQNAQNNVVCVGFLFLGLFALAFSGLQQAATRRLLALLENSRSMAQGQRASRLDSYISKVKRLTHFISFLALNGFLGSLGLALYAWATAFKMQFAFYFLFLGLLPIELSANFLICIISFVKIRQQQHHSGSGRSLDGSGSKSATGTTTGKATPKTGALTVTGTGMQSDGVSVTADWRRSYGHNTAAISIIDEAGVDEDAAEHMYEAWRRLGGKEGVTLQELKSQTTAVEKLKASEASLRRYALSPAVMRLRPPFDVFFALPEGRAALRNTLVLEFASETLDFVVEALQFRLSVTANPALDRRELALQIYNKFVDDAAVNQVNISRNHRAAIEALLFPFHGASEIERARPIGTPPPRPAHEVSFVPPPPAPPPKSPGRASRSLVTASPSTQTKTAVPPELDAEARARTDSAGVGELHRETAVLPLAELPVSIFDEARDSLLFVLENDVYPRFLASGCFVAYLLSTKQWKAPK